MMTTVRGRYPFTATQWQELEHQALIYKYMVTGMPVPADLLYTIRRSVDSSLSSKLILHQPHHIGWNCFQMGFGKKIDPEPGRCRRTDGKKWRCSKEAYPDSKYCVRHMHRGRNRSRKPVEIITATSTNTSTTTRPITTPPTAIPISSITKNTNYPSPCSPTSSPSFSYLTSSAHEPHQYPFLYPHSSSSRPPAISLSSTQDHTPKFLLEPASYSRNGYGDGMKEEVDEHVFFSEASGTMRSTCGSNLVDDTWQLSPLKMGSPMCHLKQRTHSPSLSTGHSAASYLQLQSFNDSSRQQDHHQYYYHDVKTHDLPMKMETEDHQPKKVTHHFFDEWPPKDSKDSWLDSEDKFSGLSKTQLSISIPNPSQDFFITTNEK